jgi:hypothetical protein
MVSVRRFRYPIWVGLDRSSVTNPSLKTPASTALLVELGPTAITLTSCGHPPAILVTSRGAATYLDVPAGLPLGLGDDFQQAGIAWGSGDRLLLYTDGLSEARDRHGEFLPPSSTSSRSSQQAHPRRRSTPCWTSCVDTCPVPTSVMTSPCCSSNASVMQPQQ